MKRFKIEEAIETSVLGSAKGAIGAGMSGSDESRRYRAQCGLIGKSQPKSSPSTRSASDAE